MNNHWLAIKQLDTQLKEWKAISNKYGRPRGGWIKTIREALSMTAEQLANRLGLTRARIVQLENAENHDAVTLRSIREAANAMECDFVYAIVPKGDFTLEAIIKARAEEIAHERVSRIAHSMALEMQTLGNKNLINQKNDLVKQLMEHLNKKLWAQSEQTRIDKQSDAFKQMVQNIQKKK